METTVYREIAQRVQAMKNCEKSGNDEWCSKHSDALDNLEGYLPSGSGLDSGTGIDKDRTTPNKIVLESTYHCMNENGMYDGWIDFDVIVTPSFNEIDLDIKGFFSQRHYKYANIKDYLYEIFDTALTHKIDTDDFS